MMKKLAMMLVAMFLLAGAAQASVLMSDDFEGALLGGPVDPAKWSNNAGATIASDGTTQYALTSGTPILTSPSASMSQVDFTIDTLTPSDGTNAAVNVSLSANNHSALVCTLVVQNYGAAAGSVVQYAWIAHAGGTIWLDNPPIAGGDWTSWDVSVAMNADNMGGMISVARGGTPLIVDTPFVSYSALAPTNLAIYGLGTGGVDNVVLVPEPISVAMLAVGGLLLRRRK